MWPRLLLLALAAAQGDDYASYDYGPPQAYGHYDEPRRDYYAEEAEELFVQGDESSEFRVESVECYDCHARVGTCNEGKCSGKACVKIEASVNEQRSVTKGCTQLAEEPSCVRTDMVGMEALRCVCAYDLCNADAELQRSGLAEGTASRAASKSGFPERPKRTQPSSQSPLSGIAPNYLVMLVFLSLFLTASFSLLIFNTVCIHLC